MARCVVGVIVGVTFVDELENLRRVATVIQRHGVTRIHCRGALAFRDGDLAGRVFALLSDVVERPLNVDSVIRRRIAGSRRCFPASFDEISALTVTQYVGRIWIRCSER